MTNTSGELNEYLQTMRAFFPRGATGLLVAAVALIAACSGSTVDSAASSTSNTSAIGTETGIAELDELIDRASLLVCESLDQWSEAAASFVPELRSLAATVAADQPDTWPGSPEARAAVTQLTALTQTATCDDLTGDVASARRSAAQLLGAIDDFSLAANPTSGQFLAGRFWIHVDVLGNAMEIDRRVSSGTAIETLLIGDSATKRDFDPLMIADLTGRTSMNVGSDGHLPAMITTTYEEFKVAGADPSLVVVGVNAALAYVPCDDIRPGRQQAAELRREAAFAGVAAIAQLPGERRVHGGAELAYEGKLLDLYWSRRDPAGYGRTMDGDTRTDARRSEVLAAAIEQYRTRLAAVPPCPEQPIDLRTAIETIQADGVEVVVAMMPVSPLLAELHENGRAGIDDLLDGFAEAVAPTGVDVVDLSSSLDAAQFADLTHANDDGRTHSTQLLTEALQADAQDE